MHLEENKKHCITFIKIFYLNWHSFLWLVFDPLKIHVLGWQESHVVFFQYFQK